MQKFGPGHGRYIGDKYQPPQPTPEHQWIDGEWRVPPPPTPEPEVEG